MRARRPSRPARRAILVVCEGSETEPRYFEALVRALGLKATVDVVVRGDTGYTDPKGLVDEALKLEKQRASEARKSTVLAPFEEVWVVFDIEHPGNGRARAIAPAVEAALARKLRPALSRPSFEVWYILHDRPTPPAADKSADCIRHLRRCAGGYAKDTDAAQKIADWALPRTARALEHGHRQDIFSGPEALKAFHIPSATGTAVHRLVKTLVDMASDDIARSRLGFPVPSR